jgi:chloramphenicol-sensitive protein RarD
VPDQDEFRRGLAFGATAYVMWGAFPLYFPLLEPANAVEILAQRMIWSLVVMAILVWRLHLWSSVRAVLADRRKFGLLVIAAVAVSTNWGVYIWAVNSGHVIEASLGYFINPLLTILAGVVLLGERLRSLQWLAVGVASVAIVVLAVDSGRLPWIALTLAVSFTLYGFIKNRVGVGAVESLTVETGVLALPAIATLTALGLTGNLVFGHRGDTSALLAASGLVTAIPLLLFAGASRRLPLSVVGLIQYLTPVLQFIVGVTYDHEQMSSSRWAGFGLVWVALVILITDGLRNQQRDRRAAKATEATDQPVRSSTV